MRTIHRCTQRETIYEKREQTNEQLRWNILVHNVWISSSEVLSKIYTQYISLLLIPYSGSMHVK